MQDFLHPQYGLGEVEGVGVTCTLASQDVALLLASRDPGLLSTFNLIGRVDLTSAVLVKP